MPQLSVALLATGDEIKNGDILNTNSPEIAQRLFQHGIAVGTHMVAADNIDEIETALHFLLQSHQAVIITGGLGPTSDDLTRYALAKSQELELVFDESTWNTIVTRLNQIGYQHIPEGNRQQALFPTGATILPNPYGSAAGCMLETNQQWIFMLPGPPPECLPMVNQLVIPHLLAHHFQTTVLHKNWFIFGVSEGEIAETLDKIIEPYQCTTGYRICYPYIEFKIASNDEKQFLAAIPKIHEAIKDFIIEDGKKTASEKLKEYLLTQKQSISIIDHATGGQIESILRTPETNAFLSFNTSNSDLIITVEGLKEYWTHESSKTTTLTITTNNDVMTQTVPLRGSRVKLYAAELVCKIIYQRFVTNPKL